VYRVDVVGVVETGHQTNPGGPAALEDVPIFHQPWWLDAVAPGQWDAVTIERGGRTVGRLPFVVRGPRRMRMLSQPPLTPFLGPWVHREPDAKYTTALGDEMELQAQLAAALPDAVAFRQNFSPAVSTGLPFIWAGYRADVRYTYRLEDLSSEPALWSGLAGNIRREIRKAGRQLVVRDDLGLERFHDVWAKTFARQQLAAPELARVRRIEAACAGRGVRSMLFACDAADRVHAVAYLVWDRNTAYYLMGGGDPELRTSGASSLLLWEAIRRARADVGVFDFEGSMLPPVERFFRAFGGRPTPYLRVSRTGRIAGAALAARGTAQRLLARRLR
jgi:CelD/BcsL family acetyltransferase involved in cellulose biosynthesis